MGHLTHDKDEVFRLLAERISKSPEGATINETLMAILHRLYTEKEALVGGKFSLLPMTLEQIAAITGIAGEGLKSILDGMADKGLILDIPRRDKVYYMLAPVVIGFFEYTFMRVRDNVDMRELAQLFHSYFDNKEVRDDLSRSATKMMRTVVYQQLIPLAVDTEVLTYEKAGEIIRNSGGGAISICPCRHKAAHLEQACEAPLEVCTSFGSAAEWVIRRGMGKPATVDDLLRVLDETEKYGLVHNCDNVMNKPAYMCHCCGCCCVILTGIKKYGAFFTQPSNFIPQLEPESCLACGDCAASCQIDAISMQDNGDDGEIPVVNRKLCIGCGVCVSACPSGALAMARRSALHVPPVDTKDKMTRMAKEKGLI